MADSTAREIAERLKGLIACNCDYAERTDDAALPEGFVRHANWCNLNKHGADVIAEAAAALADAEARVRQEEWPTQFVAAQDEIIAAQQAEVSALSARLAAVEQQNADWLAQNARVALRKYGQHTRMCPESPEYVGSRSGCTCGLFAALGDPQ